VLCLRPQEKLLSINLLACRCSYMIISDTFKWEKYTAFAVYFNIH
jgi:hypothetical protein